VEMMSNTGLSTVLEHLRNLSDANLESLKFIMDISVELEHEYSALSLFDLLRIKYPELASMYVGDKFMGYIDRTPYTVIPVDVLAPTGGV